MILDYDTANNKSHNSALSLSVSSLGSEKIPTEPSLPPSLPPRVVETKESDTSSSSSSSDEEEEEKKVFKNEQEKEEVLQNIPEDEREPVAREEADKEEDTSLVVEHEQCANESDNLTNTNETDCEASVDENSND